MKMFNSSPPPVGETSRIKTFMGRSTPAIGVLKSKFLTVLGNSNELLNGISSKLTLNISSSDSDYCDDDEEEIPKFDESIDYTKIDYESRRVKARRAHEEIISGRYRQPNLAPRPRLDALRSKKQNEKSRSSSSSSSSSSSTSTSSRSFPNNAAEKSHVSSTTRSDSIESRNSGGYERARAIPGARRSELDMQRDLLRLNDLIKPATVNVKGAPHIEVQPPYEKDAIISSQQQQQQHLITDNSGNIQTAGISSNHSMRLPPSRRKNSNSSTLTSLRDDPEVQVSPSVESTDWRNFIRSESQNSVPSWASSISLDCRAGEEPIKEFMKRFTETLFHSANTIDLESKSEFGALIRLDIGRQWFTRFLLEQKNKSKRIEELTFHLLVQHFAIFLFECSECEDYPPAAIVMNLCFVFYREVDVPGCDPYREYLFTFMRQQPIWLSVRFWTASFLDSLQTEREHRLAARQKKCDRRKAKEKSRKELEENKEKLITNESVQKIDDKSMPKNENSSSSSSQHSHQCKAKKFTNPKITNEVALEVDKEMENIAFRQLGSFTCNIHALGVPQDVCLEFYKKQMSGLNLPKDKIKLIRDNIYRMYHETDLWGAKHS
uniref:SBF2 domain-containing protein n=1 Tax=Glossina austeni TaxID=7395 RepID=A0A1A9VF36_GLOAU